MVSLRQLIKNNVRNKPRLGGETIPGQAARPERWSAMTLNNTALDNLLKTCDALQRRTILADGCMNSSVRAFNACMRAFTGKLPANSVTFRVYLNAPVMKPGFCKIYADGHAEYSMTDPDA